MSSRRRLFVPFAIRNDRIFNTVIIIVLTALVTVLLLVRNVDLNLPTLPFTKTGKERAAIENAHRAEMLALEAQVAQAATTAELERLRLEIETIRATHEAELERIERDAKIGAVTKVVYEAALAVAVVGLITVGLLYFLRRAVTIPPNRQGIFPLLLGRSKGALVVLDPNRSVSGIVTLGDGKPRITHYLPPGQEQATAQAQFVQAMAALSAGDRAQRPQDAARALMNASQRMLPRPAPPVERASWERGHVEQLLAESGQLEGDYG